MALGGNESQTGEWRRGIQHAVALEDAPRKVQCSAMRGADGNPKFNPNPHRPRTSFTKLEKLIFHFVPRFFGPNSIFHFIEF